MLFLISFTHTGADQNPPPADHFGQNNNATVDEVSLLYAGNVPLCFGVFVEGTYSGPVRSFALDRVDVRHASEFSPFGHDVVAGFDFNNNPTLEDVWNSTPSWGLPRHRARPTPLAQTPRQ